MSLPRWLARLNRGLINPRNVRKESWPIMTHVGRRSGTTYRTPLDAFAVDGGYIFLINYDAKRCDWVQNIVAAGKASVRIDGVDIDLTNPRIIDKAEALRQGPETVKPPPGFMKVDEYLRMDRV